MSNMDNNPQLDERIWQAWIQKNAAQDQVRFRRRVKVVGLVSLCLAFSALLFEIHKVSADVFELRPMPGFRSKTVLGRNPIARMHFAGDVDAMLYKPSRSVLHRRGSCRPSSSLVPTNPRLIETFCDLSLSVMAFDHEPQHRTPTRQLRFQTERKDNDATPS
jgi:hypothetical protein